ncbi:SDR family NAD(P)-dependent oxidoreductase [Herbidospora daliensis]|uniref:SDR family NAD(P)-dependent oxidoreductase n=1 Tax=Herbidospora daliensis TaxID=295585 RepID=UPI000785EE9F|nr:SDR family NAD(P)-dependent oxidoreductase [Herbidospora daliensis]
MTSAIVTGGASGIGYETARGLAAAGIDVTLAVRDLESGRRAAAEIGGGVGVARLDLADLATVRAFAAAWDRPLDILVNNAGIMALPELTRTGDGWELQFATNHVGHAALALGLHDALAAAGSARVVVVASAAHLMSPVHFDDLHFERRPYDPWQAYAQSKTANILFAVGAAERWKGDGITVNAVHPGGIMTNLQRHLDEAALAFVGAKDEHGATLAVPPGWKTPEQGASTSLLVATGPVGVTGRYFADDREVPVGPELAAYAVDPVLADRLWEETGRLLAG